VTSKVCPFTQKPCHEGCALYVRIVKPRTIAGYVDPESVLAYEGCGLVQQIPWRVVKRKVAEAVPA